MPRTLDSRTAFRCRGRQSPKTCRSITCFSSMSRAIHALQTVAFFLNGRVWGQSQSTTSPPQQLTRMTVSPAGPMPAPAAEKRDHAAPEERDGGSLSHPPQEASCDRGKPRPDTPPHLAVRLEQVTTDILGPAEAPRLPVVIGGIEQQGSGHQSIPRKTVRHR